MEEQRFSEAAYIRSRTSDDCSQGFEKECLQRRLCKTDGRDEMS